MGTSPQEEWTELSKKSLQIQTKTSSMKVEGTQKKKGKVKRIKEGIIINSLENPEVKTTCPDRTGS